MKRLILFIDYQNFYKDAREAFFDTSFSGKYGQFNPPKLGQLIASRTPYGCSEKRKPAQVRVYRGMPDSTKDSMTCAAYRRQRAIWEKMGIIVISHANRYPREWPKYPAQEKGVDVSLAIDFVTLAFEKKNEVGVIASTDSDLRPALEYTLCSEGVTTEVAAWRGISKKQLRVSGQRLWCHRLELTDYQTVQDTRDYNRKK